MEGGETARVIVSSALAPTPTRRRIGITAPPRLHLVHHRRRRRIAHPTTTPCTTAGGTSITDTAIHGRAHDEVERVNAPFDL